ncbi:hypothetical protein BaRGS_00035325, partial [Batillaria attramentaria]
MSPYWTFVRISCVFLAFAPAGHCADVKLQCPDEWSENEMTTLVCTVNATRLTTTVCSGQLTYTLDFNFKLAGQATGYSQCQVRDYQSQCSGVTNAGGCKCQKSARGDYVFTFTLTAKKDTHRGGSWDCSTICKDQSLRDVLGYQGSVGCSPVVFAGPVVTTENEEGCTNVDYRDHCDKTGFVCVIVFAGVLPFMVLVILFCYVELQCPEKWTESVRTTLVCTVNATRLTSTVCSGQLTDTLDFDFKVAGPSSIPVSQCQVQDYQSQCSGILNADGCKCHTSAEGNYVFTLTVTASRNTHRGGSWDCSTTCKDGTLRDVLDYRGSVGCSPVVFETEVASLELNGGNSSLTITESETDFVKITCITRGNPTPHVQLRKQQDTSDSDSDVLAQGKTEVLMSAIPTRCDSTGNYTCEADNSLGQSQQTIELTVLCPPRITTEATNISTLNFGGTPVTLTLNIVAFPRPNLTSLVSLGADLSHVNEHLVVNETMTMDCSETSVPWRVACVITVQETMTKEDEGFYRAVVMNALGRADFIFVVLIRDQEENQTPVTGTVTSSVESDADSRYAAVVLGVLLAVFAIAIVVLLIVVIRMWRRQQNASKEAGRHSEEVDTG